MGVSFLAPWVLLGLLSLPLIWWLLKVTPPAPKKTVFPPLRILAGVETEEETPNATPLWLVLLRMLMVALLVVGLAKPVMDAADADSNQELTLVVDTSWAGAASWPEIVGEAEAILRAARREDARVRLLTTTGGTGEAGEFGPAQSALDALDRLSPNPFGPEFPADIDEGVYLSGGIGENPPRGVKVFAPVAQARAVSLGAPEETADGFRVPVFRAGERGLATHNVRAMASTGVVLATADAEFKDGTVRAEAVFELPAEIRNRASRLEVAGVRSVAAVRLLDDSWGRPVIGVLNVGQDTGSPLLTEPFYAKTALRPYADIYEGGLEDVLALSPSIIVMADEARTTDATLMEWVESGGLLIRFAGEKLAERPDRLTPVSLRIGGRALGGALTWEEPQTLAEFAATSPFSGLTIPEDVVVTRQVMAEPGAETDARTWARLTDGAPIVTTDARGQGRVVLMHVTAGPEWSNLAVSGLYVEMLKRLLPFAKAPTQVSNAADVSADFAPERILDGFGQLNTAGLGVSPVAADAVEATRASPPGYYRQGTRRKALNAVAEAGPLPLLTGTTAYGRTTDRRLSGWLLGLAALLLVVDVILSMVATGRRPKLPRGLVAAAFVVALMPMDVMAQDVPPEALELHLAYVETGDARLDSGSQAAMEGVAKALKERTTIHPQGVRGVVPGVDELSFHPFLFFPVRRDSPALSAEATDALNAYMAAGGTVVFDTADFAESGIAPGVHPGLARVTEGLDVPQLATIPKTHVLTKAFYLLQVFPGRYANGDVWVEADQSGTARDGVSSVIIGSNDWAAAWAIDSEGNALTSLENDIPRQREMATRFAVNLGMYALAGNYKGDQVHTARLVERLGDDFSDPLSDDSPVDGDE